MNFFVAMDLFAYLIHFPMHRRRKLHISLRCLPSLIHTNVNFNITKPTDEKRILDSPNKLNDVSRDTNCVALALF
jgi:hypothetical protein